MQFTFENIDGVRFLKLNGVTRFIWMPKRGWQSAICYQPGILVVGLLGWCAVFAPFTPEARS